MASRPLPDGERGRSAGPMMSTSAPRVPSPLGEKVARKVRMRGPAGAVSTHRSAEMPFVQSRCTPRRAWQLTPGLMPPTGRLADGRHLSSVGRAAVAVKRARAGSLQLQRRGLEYNVGAEA